MRGREAGTASIPRGRKPAPTIRPRTAVITARQRNVNMSDSLLPLPRGLRCVIFLARGVGREAGRVPQKMPSPSGIGKVRAPIQPLSLPSRERGNEPGAARLLAYPCSPGRLPRFSFGERWLHDRGAPARGEGLQRRDRVRFARTSVCRPGVNLSNNPSWSVPKTTGPVNPPGPRPGVLFCSGPPRCLHWTGVDPGLYIVGTPIGNLDDISRRALDTLKAVNVVLAEDTRRSRRLLDRYGITTRLVSCHKFNEASRTAFVQRALAEGQALALITDSGMPGVSDPGSPPGTGLSRSRPSRARDPGSLRRDRGCRPQRDGAPRFRFRGIPSPAAGTPPACPGRNGRDRLAGRDLRVPLPAAQAVWRRLRKRWGPGTCSWAGS